MVRQQRSTATLALPSECVLIRGCRPRWGWCLEVPARGIHTEEVTGSNPVSPTKKAQSAPRCLADHSTDRASTAASSTAVAVNPGHRLWRSALSRPVRPAGRSPCFGSARSRLRRWAGPRLPVLVPDLDNALLIGEHGSLDPVAEPQFQQDACYMGLRGGLTDHESGGDLGVRQAAGDEFENLTLAGGSARPGPGLVARGPGCARTG